MKTKKHQQGFTLIEILVVFVLIAAVIGGTLYSVNIGEKTDTVEQLQDQVFLHRDMPSALIAVYIANGNKFTGIIIGEEVKITGLPGNQRIAATLPSGKSWSIGSAGTSDSIRIDVAAGDDAATMGDLIETGRLTDKVDVPAGSKTVQITYEI